MSLHQNMAYRRRNETSSTLEDCSCAFKGFDYGLRKGHYSLASSHPIFFSHYLFETDLKDLFKGRLYFDKGYLKLLCIKYMKYFFMAGDSIHSQENMRSMILNEWF